MYAVRRGQIQASNSLLLLRSRLWAETDSWAAVVNGTFQLESFSQVCDSAVMSIFLRL